MLKSLKPSTIGWIMAAILAPYPLAPLFRNALGLPISYVHVWIISIPVFAFLAYRSYKWHKVNTVAGGPVESPTDGARGRVVADGPSSLGIGLAGAVLGFAVGYLTRPTFMGEPIPMAALFGPIRAEYMSLRSSLALHMLVATGIGLVAAVVLLRIVAARKA